MTRRRPQTRTASAPLRSAPYPSVHHTHTGNRSRRQIPGKRLPTPLPHRFSTAGPAPGDCPPPPCSRPTADAKSPDASSPSRTSTQSPYPASPPRTRAPSQTAARPPFHRPQRYTTAHPHRLDQTARQSARRARSRKSSGHRPTPRGRRRQTGVFSYRKVLIIRGKRNTRQPISSGCLLHAR